MWQDDAVPDDGLVLDRDLLAQDSDRLDLEARLGHRCAVVSRRGRALNTRPASDLGVPANNRVQDTGVLLHIHVIQYNRVTDTGTLANEHVRADRDIRSKLL